MDATDARGLVMFLALLLAFVVIYAILALLGFLHISGGWAGTSYDPKLPGSGNSYFMPYQFIRWKHHRRQCVQDPAPAPSAPDGKVAVAVTENTALLPRAEDDEAVPLCSIKEGEYHPGWLAYVPLSVFLVVTVLITVYETTAKRTYTCSVSGDTCVVG